MSWTRMAPAKAFACVLLLAALTGAQTQTPTTDVLGMHDMSSTNSPLHGSNANACIYCHAPHNALSSPSLWNQTLSTNTYILNPNSTGTPSEPVKVGMASQRCLSCHDGSVGVGRTVAIGTLHMTGTFFANLGHSWRDLIHSACNRSSRMMQPWWQPWWHRTPPRILLCCWRTTILNALPATTFTTSTRIRTPPDF